MVNTISTQLVIRQNYKLSKLCVDIDTNQTEINMM